MYTVTTSPDAFPTQRVTLLLNDIEFSADPFISTTATVTISTIGLTAGNYWVRLRVDGVDSLLVDRSKTPPVYDPTQQVTVT